MEVCFIFCLKGVRLATLPRSQTCEQYEKMSHAEGEKYLPSISAALLTAFLCDRVSSFCDETKMKQSRWHKNVTKTTDIYMGFIRITSVMTAVG